MICRITIKLDEPVTVLGVNKSRKSPSCIDAVLTPAPGSSASLTAPPRALNVLNGTSAEVYDECISRCDDQMITENEWINLGIK